MGGGNFFSQCFSVERLEIVNSQLINICIIGDTLRGEVEAQVGAVGVAGLRHGVERQVMLQIELRGLTVLLQQCAYLDNDDVIF